MFHWNRCVTDTAWHCIETCNYQVWNDLDLQWQIYVPDKEIRTQMTPTPMKVIPKCRLFWRHKNKTTTCSTDPWLYQGPSSYLKFLVKKGCNSKIIAFRVMPLVLQVPCKCTRSLSQWASTPRYWYIKYMPHLSYGT